MSILNSRYTTHLEILNRLSRIIKSKEISPDDVLEWCQQVETEMIMDPDGFYNILEHELDVIKISSQYQAVLPVNVYKLKDVYTRKSDPHSRIPFRNTGTHIILNTNKKYQRLYINYLGMPFQEEPPYYPLILKGHELACEAYCKRQLYEEDFLLGRMNSNGWQQILYDLNNEIIAATVDNERHKTVDDQDKIQIIRANMIPNHGRKAIEKDMYGTD